MADGKLQYRLLTNEDKVRALLRVLNTVEVAIVVSKLEDIADASEETSLEELQEAMVENGTAMIVSASTVKGAWAKVKEVLG